VAVVIVDYMGNPFGGASSSTSYNYNNMTVSPGLTNGALLAVVSFALNNPVFTLTWDNGGTNQTMTSINKFNDATNNIGVATFGLLAPTAGNKTLNVGASVAASFDVDLISFNGVLQTSLASAFGFTHSNATSSTASIAQTSGIGNLVVGCWCAANTAGAFSSVSNTKIYIDGAGSFTAYGAASYAPGASSVTMSAVLSGGANPWIGQTINIQASAGPSYSLLNSSISMM
jgi:hypothetical protein